MATLDERQFAALTEELRERIAVHEPEWSDHNDSDPGVTLAGLTAFLAETLAARPGPLPGRAHGEAARAARALVAAAEPGKSVALTVDGASWPAASADAGPADDRRIAALLRWFLVVLGALAALAVVPAVMPTAWMEAMTVKLGLEALPRTPLTQYLTRSLSVVYAHLGVFVLWLARDVRRHRGTIVVMGWLTAALGLALTVLDFWAGMPASWSWGEGPPTVVCGGVMVWLARRLRA